MARVHHLSTSNVEHTCRRGHVIPKGQPYSWAAPGFRARKRFACAEHPFRSSELTTSKVGEAIAAGEALTDALDAIDTTDAGAIDAIREAVESFAGEIRQYADERREAADTWENGNSQLEEYADTAESAADEIESHDVEEWDGDTDARDWDAPEPDEAEQRDDPGAWQAWRDDQDAHDDAVAEYEQHVEDQLEAARALTDLDF